MKNIYTKIKDKIYYEKISIHNFIQCYKINK